MGRSDFRSLPCARVTTRRCKKKKIGIPCLAIWRAIKLTRSPEFTTSEAGGAQLQALHTLINCGWRYVTRAEADQWRDGRRTLPFLETQLRDDLARINRIHLDGRAYPFSEANIDAAVRRLAERIPEGVVRANERMTDDLLLGIALPQSIGATSRVHRLERLACKHLPGDERVYRQ